MPAFREISAYYPAALAVLGFAEQRRPTGRRFGSEADARWQALRGDLTASDRIDLLIRDASAEWPGSLSASRVFDLRAVTEDEPFGSEWTSLDAVEAAELWRELKAPTTIGEALDAIAAAWGMSLQRGVQVGEIGPAEKLVLVGPSAIAVTIAAFAESADVDWADQVVSVATPPGHRQLASSATCLLNVNKRASVVAAEQAEGLAGRRLIVSQDADAADLAWARAFKGGA